MPKANEKPSMPSEEIEDELEELEDENETSEDDESEADESNENGENDSEDNQEEDTPKWLKQILDLQATNQQAILEAIEKLNPQQKKQLQKQVKKAPQTKTSSAVLSLANKNNQPPKEEGVDQEKKVERPKKLGQQRREKRLAKKKRIEQQK